MALTLVSMEECLLHWWSKGIIIYNLVFIDNAPNLGGHWKKILFTSEVSRKNAAYIGGHRECLLHWSVVCGKNVS